MSTNRKMDYVNHPTKSSATWKLGQGLEDKVLYEKNQAATKKPSNNPIYV